LNLNSNSKLNFEKKSYKENCSLLESLLIHILFEIFRVWEDHLSIESSSTRFENIGLNQKRHSALRLAQSHRPTSSRRSQCAPLSLDQAAAPTTARLLCARVVLESDPHPSPPRRACFGREATEPAPPFFPFFLSASAEKPPSGPLLTCRSHRTLLTTSKRATASLASPRPCLPL
jgi:hypothetical protein